MDIPYYAELEVVALVENMITLETQGLLSKKIGDAIFMSILPVEFDEAHG